MAYLLERSLEDAERPTTQHDIARDVLDLNRDFDPGIDSNARVHMARLRNALELFYARLDSPPPLRFIIPKGNYCIAVLRSRPGAPPHTAHPPAAPPPGAAARRENACVIALAEPQASGSGLEIEHQLVLSEALYRSGQSPLVRCGALGLALLPPRSPAEVVELAAARGAAAVVHFALHEVGAGCRAFVSVFDTGSQRLVETRSIVSDPASKPIGFAEQIGALIAGMLTDPYTGSGPQLVAKTMRDPRLTAIMDAHRYIQTQDIQLATRALHALGVSAAAEPCVTTLALLADMHRVCSAAHHDGACLGEGLDAAARAFEADPENMAARLSLGYCALASGEGGMAAALASKGRDVTALASYGADTELLKALATDADAPVPRRAAPSQSEAELIEQTVPLVPMIKRGESDRLLEALGRGAAGEVFWLDLFRAVAAAHTGDMPLARASAERLSKKLPDVGVRAAPMLAGFFPEPHVQSHLIDGLTRAGLAIEVPGC